MNIPSSKYRLDRRLVRMASNRWADRYEQCAVLQAEILERHLDRLELVSIDPSIVVDLGSGTGRAAPGLRARFPAGTLLSIDFAERMLGSGHAGRDQPDRSLAVCADLMQLPLPGDSVDVVFCNLVLPWVNDLEPAFAEIRRVLNPRGLFSFTSCGPDTLIELRSAWAEVDQLTHVNLFPDMHDVGDMLIKSGFADPVLDVENFTLSYADVDALVADLRHSGAANFTRGRPHGLAAGGRLGSLRQAYEFFRVGDRLPATFEVIYGCAWAPAVKTSRSAGEYHYPVADIGRARDGRQR